MPIFIKSILFLFIPFFSISCAFKGETKTEAKYVSTSPAPEINSINLVYENGEISSAKLQPSNNASQYYLSNYLILDPEKLTERTEMIGVFDMPVE